MEEGEVWKKRIKVVGVFGDGRVVREKERDRYLEEYGMDSRWLMLHLYIDALELAALHQQLPRAHNLSRRLPASLAHSSLLSLTE